MVRKVETIITLTDDIDGSKADRTLAFAVDGVAYEVDLSKKNLAQFEKAVAPYVQAGRKIKTAHVRRGSNSSQRGRRDDLGQVRDWARKHGYQVSERGRIPRAVLDAYDAKR